MRPFLLSLYHRIDLKSIIKNLKINNQEFKIETLRFDIYFSLFTKIYFLYIMSKIVCPKLSVIL